MQLLIANTKDAAQRLEDKAQAWLEQNVAGYNAGQWSPLYTDGTSWGVAYEDRLAGAFSADELQTGTVLVDGSEQTVHASVIEAGTEWAVWVEPVAVSE